MKKTKLAFLLSLEAILPAPLLLSQSCRAGKAPEFDHTTWHVRDLQDSLV
jgi:hypothetical protein